MSGSAIAPGNYGPETDSIPNGTRWFPSRHSSRSQGVQALRNLGTVRSVHTFRIRAGFVKLAQLALAFSGNLEELPGQFDCLLFGVRLQNCETADHLFCFRKRTVGHTHLAT